MESVTLFFLTRNLVIENYHVPPALKTEEESKLLVSVSNEVVFLEALDKSFKSIPNFSCWILCIL